MLGFVKTKGFKYFKNLVIGIGAAIVLLGALAKLESWPNASLLLTIGLGVEAFIFAFLGIIGPEPDYYWHKLYPGLDSYHSKISPLTAGEGPKALDGEIVEHQLGGMLSELQGMSRSLGSLKALQEVDFSATGEQMKTMNNFYTRINEAMANLSETLDDTAEYKDQMGSLARNASSLNGFYDQMLNSAGSLNTAFDVMNEAFEGSAQYKDQVSSLNKNLDSLNSVYGNMLSAMSMATRGNG